MRAALLHKLRLAVEHAHEVRGEVPLARREPGDRPVGRAAVRVGERVPAEADDAGPHITAFSPVTFSISATSARQSARVCSPGWRSMNAVTLAVVGRVLGSGIDVVPRQVTREALGPRECRFSPADDDPPNPSPLRGREPQEVDPGGHRGRANRVAAGLVRTVRERRDGAAGHVDECQAHVRTPGQRERHRERTDRGAATEDRERQLERGFRGGGGRSDGQLDAIVDDRERRGPAVRTGCFRPFPSSGPTPGT